MSAPGMWFVSDGRFHEVDRTMDPTLWGERTARRSWQVSGFTPTDDQLDALSIGLASLARIAPNTGSVQSFVLLPVPWEGPAALIQVNNEVLGPNETVEDLVAALSVRPADLVEPASRDTIETPAGPAIRLRQRWVDRRPEKRSRVGDVIVYIWSDASVRAIVTLSTTFLDLEVSARWGGALDDLARGLHFDRGQEVGG